MGKKKAIAPERASLKKSPLMKGGMRINNSVICLLKTRGDRLVLKQKNLKLKEGLL